MVDSDANARSSIAEVILTSKTQGGQTDADKRGRHKTGFNIGVASYDGQFQPVLASN